ncbi:hypothetical protein A4A49_52450 [Nicotiana attenuata]|uniref:RNase H type-1 domain-containing protein n=1 Tax=Nicotiana attenuata TaxID=49451 RepID=A0A314L3Q4_NICAT|nr:hypothetical protein A4A49_52450 [Nicotiana attenuata]
MVLFSINSDINQLLKAYYPDISWPFDWSNLLSVVENLQYHTSITSVAWRNPGTGFVKVNSDGSALNNPGKIGAGVIIIDLKDHLIHVIASPLGEGSNNLAETQAATLGMQWKSDLFMAQPFDVSPVWGIRSNAQSSEETPMTNKPIGTLEKARNTTLSREK